MALKFALNDLSCRGFKPGTKLIKKTDGGGLQLWIKTNGSKIWHQAYCFGGKQKVVSLGPYPLIGLQEARKRSQAARLAVSNGSDPADQKKAIRFRQCNAKRFSSLADDYIAKLELEGRAKATMKKIRWHIREAKQRFGNRPIESILPPDVLQVAQIIQNRGHFESANRFRGTVGAVFRFGIAAGKCSVDPTQGLRGALVRHKSIPRAAITAPDDVGVLLNAIDGYKSQHAQVRMALRLLPILFVRPGELKNAEWDEVDFANKVWTVPSERTKMRKELRVPLCPQAIAILRETQGLNLLSKYIFPSKNTNAKPLSDGTLNQALRALGYSNTEVTPHGFRSTASTLLNEIGGWNEDAIELQLGHEVSGAIRRKYARVKFWPVRVEMMDWWGNYLDSLKIAARLSGHSNIRSNYRKGKAAMENAASNA